MFGFVASTTSCTPFRSTRRISSSMRRCSGSTPSSGESDPPSTWYRPRYSCVRSSESRSTGCSTTQIGVGSRRAAAPLPQRSYSGRLPGARAAGKVEWARADITTDELAPVVRGADAVVHLAWAIQPSRDLAELRRTNVDGSARVFRAVADAGVAALVYASSVGTYSPGPKDRF